MSKKGKGTLAKVGTVVGPIMAAVLPDVIKKRCRGLYDRLRGGKATKADRELKKIDKMRKNGQISQEEYKKLRKRIIDKSHASA